MGFRHDGVADRLFGFGLSLQVPTTKIIFSLDHSKIIAVRMAIIQAKSCRTDMSSLSFGLAAIATRLSGMKSNAEAAAAEMHTTLPFQ